MNIYLFREKKEDEEEWDEDEEKEDEDAGVRNFEIFLYIILNVYKSEVTADILSREQNEDDDWQENEELRVIEGLEGEFDRHYTQERDINYL